MCFCIRVILFIAMCFYYTVSAGVSIQVYSREEVIPSFKESHPRVYLKNNGTVAITNIVYYYYFTINDGKTPVLETSWYLPNTTASLEQLSPLSNAYRIKYVFSGVLYPGQVHPDASGNVVGLHYSDWSPWNKTNDYSNNLSSTFMLNENIHLFSNNIRIWGRRNHYLWIGAAPYGNGSITNPWNSVDMVNNHNFLPGDNIFIKRGTSILHNQLWPKGSGNSSEQITIDAYGTGAAPIIDAEGVKNGFISSSVYLDNQEYWTIQNLDVRNTASIDEFRSGIFIRDGDGTSKVWNRIRILSNTVQNVCGTAIRPDFYYVGGIYVQADEPARFDDVLIQDNQLSDVVGEGICFWGEYEVNGMDWSNLSTNVIIKNNFVDGTAADGILVVGTKGALLQANIVDNAGSLGVAGSAGTVAIAGLWVTRQESSLIQYNEVCHTIRWETDGQGIENDCASKGTTIFQYNYSHDNEGGFWMDCPILDPADPAADFPGAQSIVRYNMSVNDGFATPGSGVDDVEGKFFILYRSNTEIYNNTFYNIPGGGGKIVCRGPATPDKPKLWNNIFIADYADWFGICDLNTNYYGGGLATYKDTYGDPNPKADAITPFVIDPPVAWPSPMNRSSLTGLRLRGAPPTNSCINGGVLIPDNGGFDFWGNSPDANPDIGASEFIP